MGKWALIAVTLIALAGCRGDISSEPPIHIIQNMDDQPRYDPQERNPFFADGRAEREPVPGTVAVGAAKNDTVLYLGRDAGGKFVHDNPLPATPELLRRGRERFNIYCAVCHDRTGSGKGLTITNYRGMVPPPSYHDDRIRYMPDGQLFDVITNGVRTMPTYRHQIVEADRWAIVAYVRALQRSQATGLADVPPDKVGTLDF